MTINNALASVAVKDFEKATQWYERLLGRAPDSKPIRGVAEWKFPAGGGLQVYEGPQRAGGCSCTLAVADLNAESDRVKSLGIHAKERISLPTVDTIMIQDPDGNSIAFAESR